jgi:hypothetical protein
MPSPRISATLVADAATETTDAHTPGPWCVGGSLISGHDGTRVALALWRPQNGQATEGAPDRDLRGAADLDEHAGNARLLAAAPTMLDALRDVSEQVKSYEALHGENSSPICPDAVRAAIAQAAGTEQVQASHQPAPADEPTTLRLAMHQADAALDHARAAHEEAHRHFIQYIRDNLASFRLQEAYKNPDGTFSEPHWDEEGDFATQRMIDPEEVVDLVAADGAYIEMFHNPEDDPRPGCRRVINPTWKKA